MRPGIFVSRTREKLGRTCDQIGRTLEPCSLSGNDAFVLFNSLNGNGALLANVLCYICA